MSLFLLDFVFLIFCLQVWLYCWYYGQVLSFICWWGWILWLFYLVLLFVGYIECCCLLLDFVLCLLVSVCIVQLCYCEFCIDIISMIFVVWSGSQDKLLVVVDWCSSMLFSEKECLVLVYVEVVIQMLLVLDDVLCSVMVVYFDVWVFIELIVLIGL